MLLAQGPTRSAVFLWACALCVGPLAGAASPARASVAEALAMADLAARSGHVVVAEAVDDEVGWDERGRIVTDVTVRVVETFKGDAGPGALLVVRTFGGEIGGVGMRVTGAARIPVGSRVLLFLGRLAGDPWLRPVGMSQGVMPVRERDGVQEVLPGGADLHLVEPGSGGTDPGFPALRGPTPLPTVRDSLRSLLEGNGGR